MSRSEMSRSEMSRSEMSRSEMSRSEMSRSEMSHSYFINHPEYADKTDMSVIGYNRRTLLLEKLNEHAEKYRAFYEECVDILERQAGYTIQNKEQFKEDIIFFLYISGAYSLMC
jgi:hypothetical protein